MAMPAEQIRLLKEFTQLCQANPNVLHLPELQFYRDWLKSLGATLPPKKEEPSKPAPEPTPEPKAQPEPEPEPEPEEEEEVESDIELDESGVMQDDDEELPEYADENTEVTEEMIDIANDKRNDAIDAVNEGRADAPPSQPLPQLRKSYTIAEKISTVMWFRSNGRNLSEAQRKFGISRKSLRTWDKEYERLLEHSANNKMMMKKIGAGAEPLSHKLDHDMFSWYKRMKKNGIYLSNCMLMDQARHIAEGLNIKKFQGSYGWLRRWKLRFKIDNSDHRRKADYSANPSKHGGYNMEQLGGENSPPDCSVLYSHRTGCGGPVFPGSYIYQTYGTSTHNNEKEGCDSSQFPSGTSQHSDSNHETDAENKSEKDMYCDENEVTGESSSQPASGLSDDVIKEISVRKGYGVCGVSDESQGSISDCGDNQNVYTTSHNRSADSPPQFKIYLNPDLKNEKS